MGLTYLAKLPVNVLTKDSKVNLLSLITHCKEELITEANFKKLVKKYQKIYSELVEIRLAMYNSQCYDGSQELKQMGHIAHNIDNIYTYLAKIGIKVRVRLALTSTGESVPDYEVINTMKVNDQLSNYNFQMLQILTELADLL
jgi:hypothetical protein